MKRIDSQALGTLTRSLGLTGAGASETILDDGQVSQVLDIGPVVRRGRTLAGSGGIFRCVLRNVHLGDGALVAAVAPYAPGAALVVSPYPSPIPANSEIWLLGASATRDSGAAALDEGLLRLATVAMGWGADNNNAQVQPATSFNLTRWTGTVTTQGVFLLGGSTVWKRLGIRIPRLGVTPAQQPALEFATISTGGVAGTFDCTLLLGVFPLGLGQDVLV